VSNGSKRDWCDRLYQDKAGQLLLYGRALGLSHSEAEDVLQETFLALMQRAEPPLQPDYYCLRSFRNRALNHRRTLWRRITRELESKNWFDHSADNSILEQAATRCLKSLPLDQREVIVLKIWHDHTFEEIGDLLEIPASTAAGRFRYGLQKVREAMRRTFYEHNEHHKSVGDGFAQFSAAPTIGET